MAKLQNTFKVGDATFTVRALTGYDQYLVQAGWQRDVMMLVARANGHEVTAESMDTVPFYLMNMALDFAQLNMATSIEGDHPLAEHDITKALDLDTVKAAWTAFVELFKDDDARQTWIDTFNRLNKVDTDPKE
jgi:hypothetical protein